MADQLYLSYRIRGYTAVNMLRHYERMLRTFPYSKLSRQNSTLQVNAVSMQEPPVFETAFPDPLDLEAVVATMKPYACSDCAVVFEPRWDLWQFEEDWKLAPARVRLACFGPEFAEEPEDNLRIDFGVDSYFLPAPELPKSAFMAQSNLRSLLKLVHDLDNALAVESRRLWTETGENFAERLQQAIQDPDTVQ